MQQSSLPKKPKFAWRTYLWVALVSGLSFIVVYTTPNLCTLEHMIARSVLQSGLKVPIEPIANTSSKHDVAPVLPMYDNNTCWRRCPGNKRINRIVWGYYPPKGAGLSDRVYCLQRLINIAGYLCAVVEAPAPYLMLSAQHNNGVEIDPKMTWADLQNFTFLQDGQRSVIDIKTRPEISNNRCKEGQYKGYTCLKSLTDEATLDDFKIAEALSFSQNEQSTTGFVWEYVTNFYSWHRNLASLVESRQSLVDEDRWIVRPNVAPNNAGCMYYSSATPDHMNQMVDAIWNEVVDASVNKVGLLHVRRGDAVDQCDTSLPVMKQYITCTFNQSETLGPVVVFLASDETDDDYRRGVLNMLSGYAHVKAFDIDSLIWKHMREAVEKGAPLGRLNNYYRFAVMNALRPRLRFFFERRRQTCPSCSQLPK